MIQASAGQRVPVRTERQRVDVRGLTRQRLSEQAGPGGILDIPKLYGARGVADGQGLPVGVEGHRVNAADISC